MERILVGVDGSVPSRAAIRWSVDRARTHAADVVLVHVIDDEWGVMGSQLVGDENQEARDILDGAVEFAQELAPHLDITTVLASGSPMWELSQLSSKDTLVVVGTHKTGFHYGRAFGSRSLQLASLAAGPIAVIPESAVRLRSGVVVGIDETPAGRIALDIAADEADRNGSELTLIRASSLSAPMFLDEAGRRDWQAQRDGAAHRILADAVGRVQAAHPNLATRSRIIRRSPGVALSDVSRTAELLVVGSSRRSGFEPDVLGTVAYDVLLNLVCPTVVVHAPIGVPAGREAHSEQKAEHHEPVR
jgi:nucleotide-binding universal stress UspA family protein